MKRYRWVVDTNALISRLLLPDTVPARAVRRAVDTGTLLVSEETLDELAEVLNRPKFDHYVSPEDRQGFLQRLMRISEQVAIIRPIQACRDPKDDRFLSVAVNGEADALITGDHDLLELHPFMTIPILTPATFLDWPLEESPPSS